MVAALKAVASSCEYRNLVKKLLSTDGVQTRSVGTLTMHNYLVKTAKTLTASIASMVLLMHSELATNKQTCQECKRMSFREDLWNPKLQEQVTQHVQASLT